MIIPPAMTKNIKITWNEIKKSAIMKTLSYPSAYALSKSYFSPWNVECYKGFLAHNSITKQLDKYNVGPINNRALEAIVFDCFFIWVFQRSLCRPFQKSWRAKNGPRARVRHPSIHYMENVRNSEI